jgi:hypothetical protein
VDLSRGRIVLHFACGSLVQSEARLYREGIQSDRHGRGVLAHGKVGSVADREEVDLHHGGFSRGGQPRHEEEDTFTSIE